MFKKNLDRIRFAGYNRKQQITESLNMMLKTKGLKSEWDVICAPGSLDFLYHIITTSTLRDLIKLKRTD